MTRIFGHYVPVEMALLGGVELLLSYVLIEAMPSSALEPAAGILAVMLACTIGATAATIGLYRPEALFGRKRLFAEAALVALAAYPAVLGVSEILHVTLNHDYLLWLAELILAWTAGMLILRSALGMAIQRKLFTRRVLLIGDGEHAARAADAAASVMRTGFFDLIGVEAPSDIAAGPSGPLSPGRLQAERVWGLVVAADARARVPARELLQCKLAGIRIYDEAQFWERHLGRINLEALTSDWMAFADGFSSGRAAEAMRRVADVTLSLGLMLFTLPLMAMVAVAIKLDSPGPVIYRQQRIGLRGRTFTLCKFRSMRNDAEIGGARWASRRDPRVTRVGAFIRTARIDELPQLLNVLRGEMSFVGPRPERPLFVEELARVIPFYNDRAHVKPGITGWAQVNFPYGASVEDARQKLSYDLYYVKNRSIFLDVLILLATVRVILFQEGAR